MEQAWEITACLRQGRLFYECAQRSPLEIRPLELYYGAAAYAKSLVLATDRSLTLGELEQSHGVKDASGNGARLETLQIAVQKSGAFHQFNDCVARLNCVKLLTDDDRRFSFPCAVSTDLAGVHLTLKDIFSRLPGLDKLYKATFGERGNSDGVEIFLPSLAHSREWTVRIHEATVCESAEQAVSMIRSMRNRIPFLNRWTFKEARVSWGQTSFTFYNSIPQNDDSVEAIGNLQDIWFNNRQENSQLYEVSEANFLTLAGSGIIGYYVQPVRGKYLAEHSLNFLALHLLSSLVRYRPAIWMHALARTSSNGRAADDAMLAVVESFLENVMDAIPRLVVGVIAPGLQV